MSDKPFINEDDFFNDDTNLAELPTMVFWKKGEVGDRVVGELFKIVTGFQGKYGAQTVYVMKNAKGIEDGKPFEREYCNHGLSEESRAGEISRANVNHAEIGDIIGWEYTALEDNGFKRTPARVVKKQEDVVPASSSPSGEEEVPFED